MLGQDYGERDVDLVHQRGFRGAVLTARGVSDRGADALQLRRFTTWDRNLLQSISLRTGTCTGRHSGGFFKLESDPKSTRYSTEGTARFFFILGSAV